MMWHKYLWRGRSASLLNVFVYAWVASWVCSGVCFALFATVRWGIDAWLADGAWSLIGLTGTGSFCVAMMMTLGEWWRRMQE